MGLLGCARAAVTRWLDRLSDLVKRGCAAALAVPVEGWRRITGSMRQHAAALRFYGGTLALVLVGTPLFIWGSRFERWLPWVVTSASGFGAFLCAAGGLMPPETRGRWLMIAAGALFATWATWYTAFDQSGQINSLRETVEAERATRELVQSDMRRYVGSLPPDQIAATLKQAGVVLANRFAAGSRTAIDARRAFRASDFAASQDVISFISALDKAGNNGHVLYFSGEIARKTGDPDKGHGSFFVYLETERTLIAESRTASIGIEACRTAGGYCRQRSAWINHLLANDIYQETLRKKKAAEAKAKPAADAAKTAPAGSSLFAGDLRKALGYACDALSLLKVEGRENEFRDPGQLEPTKDLVAQIKNELHEETCP